MKRLILILASVFFITLEGRATSIPLDSIRESIFQFLKETELCSSIDAISYSFIVDRKKGAIKEGKEGVFDFLLLYSGARRHYLLVAKEEFRILNMKDPIDLNVCKLLDFLEKYNYSREDILFYLRQLIKTHKRNEETIASFNGVIK